jgi:hypothetical protein
MTWLIAAFLIAHGTAHLPVWLPPSPSDAGPQAPFAPDHSALLTRTRVPQATSRRIAVRLAGTAAVLYVVAGLGVALGSGWAVAMAATAAIVGLALKLLYINPWLTVGIFLDAAVLSAALLSWPVGLV